MPPAEPVEQQLCVFAVHRFPRIIFMMVSHAIFRL